LFNPSGADGSNVAFGRTVLQALKTGTFNVGIGLNVLSGITNTSYNTAIGINAGQNVFGNYCTCIGTNSGQLGGTRLENSTSIGKGSQFTASNQVMIGTTSDTVVCPNVLVVDGTNVLTRISDAISTGFTNFLAGSNQWSGSNAFGLIYAGSNGLGNFIKMDSGIMTVAGTDTGIIMPDTSYLKIGNNILNGTLISYLKNITSDVQSQINSLKNKSSGEVIQMRVFSRSKDNLLTTVAPPNGQSICLFQFEFKPKSTSSQIYVTFDAYWSIRGGGYDEWQSIITSKEGGIDAERNPIIIIGAKNIRYSSDGRYSAITLFPISGGYNNTTGEYLTVKINVSATQSDDNLYVDNLWNLTITEVQN
jgi:hypothetical protein